MSSITVAARFGRDTIKATARIGTDRGYTPDVYDGDMQKTVLLKDEVFETAGKMVTGDLTAKIGYRVIRGTSGNPKEYDVGIADQTISDAIAYPDGIKLKQALPVYTGATSFAVADSNITIPTSGKRLNSNLTVDISAVSALAEEISEVVG